MSGQHNKMAAALLASTHNVEARGNTPQATYAVAAYGRNDDAYVVVYDVRTDTAMRIQHVYVNNDGLKTVEMTQLPADVHVMFNVYRKLFTECLRLVASKLSKSEDWVYANRERLFLQHLASMPQDYAISRAMLNAEDVKLMQKLPDWNSQLDELYRAVFSEVQAEALLPFLSTEQMVQPTVFA